MRRTAVAIGALFFTNGAAYASWAPRIPEIADRVGLDVAGLGLTLVMVGVGGTLGTRPAGALIDRFGSRRTAVWGALVVALGLPMIGVAGSPVAFGLALAIVGVADVVADLGMNAQAMVVQAGGLRLINRFHGLWSVGTVVGGILGAAAAGARVNLEAHLTTVAVLVAMIAGVAFRSLTTEALLPPPPTAGSRSARARPLVVLALLGLFAAFMEAPGNEWSATFLDETYGAAPGTAALGFVAFTIGMTVSRLSGDSIAVRIGGGRALRLSLGITATGWLVATLPGSIPAAVTGLAIAGLGTGMVFPQLYAAGGSGQLVSQGRGLSAMSLGARLGFLLATPIIGLAGSRLGLDVALLAIGLVAVAASALLSSRGGATG